MADLSVNTSQESTYLLHIALSQHSADLGILHAAMFLEWDATLRLISASISGTCRGLVWECRHGFLDSSGGSLLDLKCFYKVLEAIYRVVDI